MSTVSQSFVPDMQTAIILHNAIVCKDAKAVSACFNALIGKTDYAKKTLPQDGNAIMLWAITEGKHGLSPIQVLITEFALRVTDGKGKLVISKKDLSTLLALGHTHPEKQSRTSFNTTMRVFGLPEFSEWEDSGGKAKDAREVYGITVGSKPATSKVKPPVKGKVEQPAKKEAIAA